MPVPGCPFVSIVTPVYNGARVLSRCLESVAGQSYPHFEHLVVDGGSTDGTLDILRAHEVAWWVSERDHGIFDAMNKGIDAARGDWLYFIGADDALLDPDALARCEPYLRDDAALVYGDVRYTAGRRVRSRLGPRLLLHNTVHHQGAFYARRVFDGWRYDAALRVVADYELNLRLYCERQRCVRADVVVAECAEGGASRTQLRNAFRETNLVRSRHLGPASNAALALVFAAEFGLYRLVGPLLERR